MKIIKNLSEFLDENVKIATTIGNFDGLHIGHRKLIEKLKLEAKSCNLKTAVVTFFPHPQKFFKKKIELINTYDQKIEIFRELGLDYYIEIPFDEKISGLTPNEFLNEILVDKLDVKMIVVGSNYKFGFKQKGDVDLLEKFAKNNDIKTFFLESIKDENDIVISSSRCRQLLYCGNVERVKQFLERPFSVKGVVVSGDEKGREYGFPTANIETRTEILPGKGVYTTEIIIDQKTYKAITYVGTRPTVDHDEGLRKIETYIFDFSEYIYDKILEINFHTFIRAERKFSSLDKLIAQMKLDSSLAKTITNDDE